MPFSSTLSLASCVANLTVTWSGPVTLTVGGPLSVEAVAEVGAVTCLTLQATSPAVSGPI